MYKKKWYFITILLYSLSALCMVDNRFLVPNLFQKPFLLHSHDRKHHLTIQPFAMTARSAFGQENGIENENELFEVFGRYDQTEIDKALQLSGRTSSSLFRSDWQGYLGPLHWLMKGHFDVYGLGFHYRYDIHQYFSMGIIAAAMHANSRMETIKDRFSMNQFIADPGNFRELFLLKNEMNELLDLCPGLWQKNAVADIDIYIRPAFTREYFLKCRRFDTGCRIGVLAPAAPERNINNPASVPLGGDRHWGMYVSLEGDFDVHEDIQMGFSLQFIKRFARTACHRMPAACEPDNYGAIIGIARVHPGLTIGFNPYVAFKEVREGLGFLLAYNLTAHSADNWHVLGAARKLHPNIPLVEKRSEWRSEHATIGAFYDCAYTSEVRQYEPVVSFTWDIPVDWLLAKRAFRTHGISFIVEMQF